MKDNEMEFTEDQKKFFHGFDGFMKDKSARLSLLTGSAGTGKTYAVASRMSKMTVPVVLTAPTNQAVGVLAGKAGCSVEHMTLHRAIGLTIKTRGSEEVLTLNARGPAFKPEGDALMVVDESSMADSAIFKCLVEYLDQHANVKVLFVGDAAQLPPIGERQSVIFSMQDDIAPYVWQLREVVRQDGGPLLDTLCVLRDSLSHQDVRSLIPDTTRSETGSIFRIRRDQIVRAAVKKFGDGEDTRVLGWRNSVVDSYNMEIRKALRGDTKTPFVVGEPGIAGSPIFKGEEIAFQTSTTFEVEDVTMRRAKFFDEVVELWDLRISDGYEAPVRTTFVPPEFKSLVDRHFSNEASKITHMPRAKQSSAWTAFWKEKRKYGDVRWAYAMTVHKAQGTTFQSVIVDIGDMLMNPDIEERNRLVYTACSRPSDVLIYGV